MEGRRPSNRFRDMLEEMGERYPGSNAHPPRVRVNKRPSLGFSYSLEPGQLRVDISDILLERSPDEVLNAIVELVLLGAYKDAWSSEKRRLFERHKRRLESDEKVIRELLTRDRTIRLRPSGNHHDLQARFDDVNQDYFGGKVPPLNLAWSSRVERTRWGYTDREQRLIVVNRQLDRPGVPRFVVDYLLFHEMLHIMHRGLVTEFGQEDHYISFNKEEKRFRRYDEAEAWLDSNG